MANASMTTISRATVAATLALSLLAAPLAACGNQAAQGDGSDASAEQVQAADIDVSSWQTLGDALAYDKGENSAAGWDEEHYVTVFSAGDSVVRVVAKMDPKTYEALNNLDMSDEDYDEKFLEVMGGLQLESAEDLTADVLSQEVLDGYVGKTGQDLVDDGFSFEYYSMYGGDETGCTMAKGPLAYEVLFDASVPEDKTEDGGASIMGATITGMSYTGASEGATDPSAV